MSLLISFFFLSFSHPASPLVTTPPTSHKKNIYTNQSGNPKNKRREQHRREWEGEKEKRKQGEGKKKKKREKLKFLS
jgi:hypothetical protein